MPGERWRAENVEGQSERKSTGLFDDIASPVSSNITSLAVSLSSSWSPSPTEGAAVLPAPQLDPPQRESALVDIDRFSRRLVVVFAASSFSTPHERVSTLTTKRRASPPTSSRVIKRRREG
jgi:hypothetical protein